MKSETLYVDGYGKLRTRLKFRKYNNEFSMSGEKVIEKVMEKLIEEEKYEECIRMKKFKESLNNK